MSIDLSLRAKSLFYSSDLDCVQIENNQPEVCYYPCRSVALFKGN